MSNLITQFTMNIRSRAFTLRVDLIPTEQAGWLPKMLADVDSHPTRFARLVIGGPEIAPTTGLRHVHVYVEFDNQKTAPQIIKLLHLTGLVHWIKPAQKKDSDNICKHHCKFESKEDETVLSLLQHPATLKIEEDQDSDEVQPSKKQKCSMDQIRRIIETTGDVEQVKNLSYATYMRSSGFIDKECAKYRPKTENVKQNHIWIHGDPGTGKTAICHVLFPDAHFQDVCNPNFEDYNNHQTVVFNDFDNQTLRLFTVAKLKNLCDPAGAKCKVNYGCVHVKARIVVTSNFTIAQAFQYKGKNAKWQDDFDESNIDYQAIKRRFKEVHINKYLFKQNLQLKSKSGLREAKNEEDCFEPFDPEHKTDDDYSECNYSEKSTQTDWTNTSNGVYATGFNPPPSECSSTSTVTEL